MSADGLPIMAIRRQISGVDRGVAVVLAVVWLCAGATGMVLGWARGQPVLVLVGAAAIVYAALWFRVAARSRLLSWRALFAPWRP